jgi:hypothetical protein
MHSLSFNDREKSFYSQYSYINALDEFHKDRVNSIYSYNSQFLEGNVYLNKEDLKKLLYSNPEFIIDGVNYLIITASDIDITQDNGCIVKVKLAKKI